MIVSLQFIRRASINIYIRIATEMNDTVQYVDIVVENNFTM